MKKKGFAVLLGVVMIGAAVGTATQVYTYAENTKKEETAEESAAVNPFSTVSTADLVDNSDTLSYSGVADIAEAAMPSIVAITNKSVQEVQSFFRGQTFQYESESSGSGIIMGENDTELLICTNNHVVEDATQLTVTFIDENSYEAQIKGTDPANDLAVVDVNKEDIDEDTMDQIKIARMGDSDDMRVG